MNNSDGQWNADYWSSPCWSELLIPLILVKCESRVDWQNCRLWIQGRLTGFPSPPPPPRSIEYRSGVDWQNCWLSIQGGSTSIASPPPQNQHNNCSRKMITLSGIVPNLIFFNILIVLQLLQKFHFQGRDYPIHPIHALPTVQKLGILSSFHFPLSFPPFYVITWNVKTYVSHPLKCRMSQNWLKWCSDPPPPHHHP